MLKGVSLPEALRLTYRYECRCRTATLLVLATPSFAVRTTARKICNIVEARALWWSAWPRALRTAPPNG